jgi:hypothetical protein
MERRERHFILSFSILLIPVCVCYFSHMKETDLVAWHGKEYLKRRPRAFYYKIPDTLGVGGKKPFDVIIDDVGTHRAIEFKLHKSHTAFSLAHVQPHQIENLLLAQENGRIATVYIGIRFTMDVETQERLEFRIRRIKVDLEYPIDEIVAMIEAGKKSIKVLPLLKKAING